MSSLVYLLVWALHLIFHTFLRPISVFFSQHMPIPSQPVLLWQKVLQKSAAEGLIAWDVQTLSPKQVLREGPITVVDVSAWQLRLCTQWLSHSGIDLFQFFLPQIVQSLHRIHASTLIRCQRQQRKHIWSPFMTSKLEMDQALLHSSRAYEDHCFSSYIFSWTAIVHNLLHT